MTNFGLSTWEVRGQLGRGGTARVDRVSRPDSTRDFALKRALPDQTDPAVDFAELARREYELIGGLRFPGLVRLLEHGAKPEPYLLMEKCPGASVDALGRVDDLQEALNLFSAMAITLEFIRLRGICHGDIKPHNFFLPEDRRSIASGRLFFAKLSDFSLGRFDHESDSCRLGSGTVGYMAPETIDTNAINHRTDLFALGVTAYQIFTGEHPFIAKGKSDPAVINSRVKEERPEPVRILRKDCPEPVADLIQNLLANEPASRPKSAWQVCEILERSGATYPYRLALAPSFAIDGRESYESNLARILRLRTRQRKRLDLVTGSNVTILRLVLNANFRCGFLAYDGERFVFSQDVYWPNRLRRRLLSLWSSIKLSEQKAIIKAAIGGGRVRIPISSEASTVSPAETEQFTELIQPLLRSHLVRRLSHPVAVDLDESGQFEQAAGLYLQAGDLDRSVACAASIEWKQKADHAPRLLSLLHLIIDFATMSGRIFAARQLLMISGDLQKSLGDANAAEKTYKHLVELYSHRPADELLAETYKDLGDLYKIKQDLARGLKAVEKALEIYRRLNNELEVSHVLNNIGNLHFFGANFKEAAHYYTQALRIQRRLGAQTDVASTLSNIGAVYAIRGRFKRSVRTLELALGLKRDLGDAGEIARTLNNLGYLYHVMGSNQRGIDCLTESLELNQKTGNQKEILYNLENLGTVMIAAGRLRRSVDYLKEGSVIAARLDDRPHMGVFALRLSTVARRLGVYRDAERRLVEASELAEGIDDWFLRVSCSLERAKMYHYLGRMSDAGNLAEKARTEAARIGEKPLQLEARLLLIRISPDEEHVEQAHRLADDLHLSREHILVDFNRADLLLTTGQFQEARHLFEHSRKSLELIGEDLELPRMLITAANLMYEAGQQSDAGGFAQRALAIAKSTGMAQEQIEAHIALGRMAFAHGDYEKCYADYREALSIAKKCSESIDNAGDRAVYQQRPPIQFLAREIRRLSELLGQKTKGR